MNGIKSERDAVGRAERARGKRQESRAYFSSSAPAVCLPPHLGANERLSRLRERASAWESVRSALSEWRARQRWRRRSRRERKKTQAQNCKRKIYGIKPNIWIIHSHIRNSLAARVCERERESKGEGDRWQTKAVQSWGGGGKEQQFKR